MLQSLNSRKTPLNRVSSTTLLRQDSAQEKLIIQIQIQRKCFGCPFIFIAIGVLIAPTALTRANDNHVTNVSRSESVEAEVERLLGEMTLEEKVSLCHANGKFTTASVTRLGIKEMWMSNSPLRLARTST